jgi:hypothetical protein
VASDGLSAAPVALIRTMEGHIAFWSPAMEQRYGFAAEEAVGKVSHQLLRTASWQTFDEITAELVDRNSWHGGLIHHRADGQPVMVANHWHLHPATNDQGRLVTELHSEIVPAGTDTAIGLADILTTVAHELSQKLTGAGNYVRAAQRTLQQAALNKTRLDHGITEAVVQVAQTAEILQRLRALGDNLRDPRLSDAHAKLTATFSRTEHVLQRSREVASEAKTVLAETILARQERGRTPRRSSGSDAASARRTVVLKNIQLLRRLVQMNADDKLDVRMEQAFEQLLVDEKGRLATLDQQE